MPAKTPVIHGKSGRLTVYGFACGYIERYEKDTDNRVTLDLDGVWHVKGFVKGVHFWECRDTLTEARKVVAQKKREMR